MKFIKADHKELLKLIRQFYESDFDHIMEVHETSRNGMEFCINRTVADYVLNDVAIYKIIAKDKLIGYFGDYDLNNEKWLTGFFIFPDKRKEYKNQVWEMISNHFNGQFKVGSYLKNKAFSRFLEKNDCKFLEEIMLPDGPANVYIYGESN